MTKNVDLNVSVSNTVTILRRHIVSIPFACLTNVGYLMMYFPL